MYLKLFLKKYQNYAAITTNKTIELLQQCLQLFLLFYLLLNDGVIINRVSNNINEIIYEVSPVF